MSEFRVKKHPTKTCPQCGEGVEAKASQMIPNNPGTILAWEKCTACDWARDLPAGTPLEECQR